MSELQAMQAQLQQLQDLEEIRSLRHRYAYLANIVDGQPGDPEEFARLFAEDGTLDLGMGLATGRAEIVAMMKSATTQWVCAMHYMLNPVIELQGQVAKGKVSGLFAFTTRSNPSPIWLSNIYSDSYVRTGEGWKFQSVAIKTTFVDPAFQRAYAELLK
ncbi:nuclear transport factor 2 family protein [Halopseudomonas xiamenensis]|uniref:nuclear transport factor 2 family protein n=1 Tax=Halopseudomonas xiamenensis TaxID=157792 RepID=UPI0016232AED|nr:nuclear transport factor 2 family protein [Halopseudomonas xiamenensis]